MKWHKLKCGTHRICHSKGGTSVNFINVYPDRRWLAAAMNHATSDGLDTPPTIEEAKKQALDAIRAKVAVAVKAFGGSVVWCDPVKCGACGKLFNELPLLVCGTDGNTHEFCSSCSAGLNSMPRGNDARASVDAFIARKRSARRRGKH